MASGPITAWQIEGENTHGVKYKLPCKYKSICFVINLFKRCDQEENSVLTVAC